MDFAADIRHRLVKADLWPTSRLGRVTAYLFALDIGLFILQKLMGLFHSSAGSPGGWVSFLSFTVIVLFVILSVRWLKAKMLWRLRNRLIVTYVFIGVIPAVLLVAMGFISLYLFAGQFANFAITSELKARLRSLDAINEAVANELAAQINADEIPSLEKVSA